MPLLPADFIQPEPANNFAHNSGRDAWSEQARAQKKKYDEGAITLEDFQRWLKES